MENNYILLHKDKISLMMRSLYATNINDEQISAWLDELDKTITSRQITHNKIKITMNELNDLKQLYEQTNIKE